MQESDPSMEKITVPIWALATFYGLDGAAARYVFMSHWDSLVRRGSTAAGQLVGADHETKKLNAWAGSVEGVLSFEAAMRSFSDQIAAGLGKVMSMTYSANVAKNDLSPWRDDDGT